MKKILVFMVFCAAISISLTGFDRDQTEKSMITSKSANEDTGKSANVDTEKSVDEDTGKSVNEDIEKRVDEDTGKRVNVEAEKNVDEDIEKSVNVEIKNNDTGIMSLEYADYAYSFEYNGRKFLYSKIQFIQSHDYTYFVLDADKKEIAITKITNAEGEVAIPGKLDGYKVVSLGVPLNNFSAYEEGLYNPKSQYSVFEKDDKNKITCLIQINLNLHVLHCPR